MGKFRGLDDDPGWINRKFRDVERQMREMRASMDQVVRARTLQVDAWHVVGAGTEPAFQNDLTALPGFPLQFLRSSAGTVEIAGGVSWGAQASGTVVFTLPTGYRPLVALRDVIASTSAAATARLVVETTGEVVIHSGIGAFPQTGYHVHTTFSTLGGA